MSSSGSSSLRPAWKGGRGFQPPPTVTSDRDSRRGSTGGSNNDGPPSSSKRDSNKFAALDDDDDIVASSKGGGLNSKNNNSNNHSDPKQNSRSEAFRSSFGSRASTSKPGGRSLADLAARVPEGMPRQSSTGYPNAGGGPSRFSGLGGRQSSTGGSAAESSNENEGRPVRGEVSEAYKAQINAKVIKYTREKLLSIRPRPNMDIEFPPPHLKHVDAAALLAEQPQDPGKSAICISRASKLFGGED
jgi:hypothetical protein